jgi:4-coumarate--CoA ligase
MLREELRLAKIMIHGSSHDDIAVPRLDILSLLFGEQATSRQNPSLPCPILTAMTDSEWCWAAEDTKIHIEAAHPENSVTKAEARLLTKRLAHILRSRFGIGESGAGQDAVLTVFYGSPFAPVFFYGLVAAGGVYCGAGTESSVLELVRQIKDAEVTLLVCSRDCADRVVEAARQCRISRERVLILDSSRPHGWQLLTAADGSHVLAQNRNKALDWLRITDQQDLERTTICLLYSSGTTGPPKGVRISHWGLVANNVCTMAPARRYKTQCKSSGGEFAFNTIAHLPMANIAGINLYATNPFYMGGSTYWMPKYDFDAFLEHHKCYRPAYQFSVPPIWLRIAKSDKVTNHFDALQVAVTGSAPIGLETLREVQKKLGRGKAHMAQTWGATECCGVITATEWTAFSRIGSWSVGEPCSNVTLRVVDDSDQDVPDGQPGELLVGGPILAQEYHNRPAANRDTFVNGYYRTGDIGTIQNGLVHIVDRKKELIKYKAQQVAPAELEALLTSHPAIADAAVIGIWDAERETEVPRGYVVRQTAQVNDHSVPPPVSADEVVNFVRENVASYKQLRGGVFFLDEIPKSASGKILRKELRGRQQVGTLPAKL